MQYGVGFIDVNISIHIFLLLIDPFALYGFYTIRRVNQVPNLDFLSWILFRIPWLLAISRSLGLPSLLHMLQAHHCPTIIILALGGDLPTFVVVAVLNLL